MERKMMEEEEEEEIFYSPRQMEEENEENGIIYNDDEKKIGQLRAIILKQDPACKDIDDLTLRRFLIARDLDVEKASAMFIKYIKWRQDYVPNGFISVSEIKNQIADNKMFMQGTDKKGRPVSVIFAARHFPSKEGPEELKRALVFTLDKLCSRIPDGQEKFIVIAEFQGYGYSNSDVRAYTAGLSILQDYYPERLGKLFIIHAPYVFMTVWKIIYPFIDKNTKKKIIFVENKKLKATLLEEIDESQLPEIYGGKQKLVPIQDA